MKRIDKILINLWIDLGISIMLLKIYIRQLFYISEIQKMTFLIIYQLQGFINNEYRFTKKKIINNLMLLQEALLDETENQLSYIKIFELKVFFKRMLYDGITYSAFEKMDIETHDQIYKLFDQITNELSTTNYLDEKELSVLIDGINKKSKHKYIKIKRK